MSLRALIRQSVPAGAATATPATVATLPRISAPTVAGVAAVAVANAPMLDLTGLPAEWREGLSWLASGPVPTDHHEARWRARVGDALRLASEWGVTAHALGWDTLNLFGHEPNPFARRLDTMGLAALLEGRPVAALDFETATILDPSGARMRFQRFPGIGATNPARGSVPMWRLEGATLATHGEEK